MTQAASIDVRRLTETDAPALYELRGEALETEPASFGESLAEYRQTTVDRYSERLRSPVAELLQTARTVDGLERVVLTVTQTPSPARELYLSLGFQPFGIEPKALKLDGRHINEEYMVLELGVAEMGA
jgi:hypothetical protein